MRRCNADMWSATTDFVKVGRKGGQTVRCCLGKGLTQPRGGQDGGTEAYMALPLFPVSDSSPACFKSVL